MKSRLILPVLVALLASETFAGNLPSTRGLSVELDPGEPPSSASPGIAYVKGHRGQPVQLHSRNRAEYLQGLPVSPHQLQILGFDDTFAFLPLVNTAMTTPAD